MMPRILAEKCHEQRAKNINAVIRGVTTPIQYIHGEAKNAAVADISSLLKKPATRNARDRDARHISVTKSEGVYLRIAHLAQILLAAQRVNHAARTRNSSL